ncbi:hypothetical protein [Marinobacter sp. AN1]|uniref:hypothetical protein n=1 Tax=Marinobacter sp. AN1 TaxID=2886046 RepID=UPI00222E9DAA|nr:hypothetical protein [Marinobacter sp. AN1]UZD64655.1 hypothetical protein LJ360_13680 [Marinobacter sp. AN1]
MRGRFPEPFADFRGALEALQSDIAYLPEMSGEIVAYSRDGRWFEIPTRFFIRRPPRFADREAAEQWVRERQQAIEQGKPGAKSMGYVVARPGDPIEKQIDDALAFRDCRLVGPEENDAICERVARWLAEQVDGEWCASSVLNRPLSMNCLIARVARQGNRCAIVCRFIGPGPLGCPMVWTR